MRRADRRDRRARRHRDDDLRLWSHRLRQPRAGGVLHGTGIVRDGELRFQNNDGSQYSFKPFYADLAGRLTTPQGQSYEAIFKKTY